MSIFHITNLFTVAALVVAKDKQETVALYRGNIEAAKCLRKKSIDMTNL